MYVLYVAVTYILNTFRFFDSHSGVIFAKLNPILNSYSFWGADCKQIVPISHFNVSSFNHQKTATKTWLLSSFEEDYSYLFNSQPIFTYMNHSENIIVCLVQGSRLELCPVLTFAAYFGVLLHSSSIHNLHLNTQIHLYFPFLCRL